MGNLLRRPAKCTDANAMTKMAVSSVSAVRKTEVDISLLFKSQNFLRKRFSATVSILNRETTTNMKFQKL